jgi:hypothetical protein
MSGRAARARAATGSSCAPSELTARSSARDSDRSIDDDRDTAATAPAGVKNSFSGEVEGAVPRLPSSAGTSQDSRNSAAERATGQAVSST